jgi:hypothetical protein
VAQFCRFAAPTGMLEGQHLARVGRFQGDDADWPARNLNVIHTPILRGARGLRDGAGLVAYRAERTQDGGTRVSLAELRGALLGFATSSDSSMLTVCKRDA